MNTTTTIKEYVQKTFLHIPYSTEHTIYDSYIYVHENMSLSFSLQTVIVNEVLDVGGNCSLYHAIIEKPINVQGTVLLANNKLLPGSFVGEELKDDIIYNGTITVNGYITQSGIIS